ncbi:hypothetical protein, partial [Streptomyces clavuligerus]|uniref:hypothetical protein n=1 Tax=Streptomyces clavuligerus TaxID=1901 RepID=UPI001E4199E7
MYPRTAAHRPLPPVDDDGPAPAAADDVVWSLRRLRNTPAGASRLPGIKAANITADGPRTVV